jgi:HEAT repeat protein
MTHTSGEVRRAATGALGRIGDKRAAAALTVATFQPDARLRHAAGAGLARIDPAAGWGPLLEAMRESRLGAAADVLAGMKDKTPVQACLAALKHADAGVRSGAAAQLGRLGSPGEVAALRQALKDPDRRVVRAAVGALGEIGDPGAVKALLAARRGPDEYVRRAADAALRRMGYPL